MLQVRHSWTPFYLHCHWGAHIFFSQILCEDFLYETYNTMVFLPSSFMRQVFLGQMDNIGGWWSDVASALTRVVIWSWEQGNVTLGGKWAPAKKT